MGITLSHTSALHAVRSLRTAGINVRELEGDRLSCPVPWEGRRWTMRNFKSPTWIWPKPRAHEPLHIMVPSSDDRIWTRGITCHVYGKDLPTYSILWLDEYASIVSPPLLFLQMAQLMSMPALVMLGYELCGCFSRDANDPLEGRVTDKLPPATSTDEISAYLKAAGPVPCVRKARVALSHVNDYALSTMEALLGTMYSLPTDELGYAMGPIMLNQRVKLSNNEDARSRFPDLMFSFAPIGINYDGEDHLDLDGLIGNAKVLYTTADDNKGEARKELLAKKDAIRAKVVDDLARNRQLIARGKIVLPATKENLYGQGHLDEFTRDLLRCAKAVFDVDTRVYEKSLNDSELCRERYQLLSSMLPFGRPKSSRRELL